MLYPAAANDSLGFHLSLLKLPVSSARSLEGLMCTYYVYLHVQCHRYSYDRRASNQKFGISWSNNDYPHTPNTS
jgi:hypothetical protein